jgi:hypothetical protein
MRYLKLTLLVFTVWTYGSEVMDTLIMDSLDQTEWLTFKENLRCDVKDSIVSCIIDTDKGIKLIKS